MPTRRPRHIVVMAFDRVQLLDVAGPLQAFATAGELETFRYSPAPYRLTLVSRRGGEVATSSGLRFIAEPFDAVRRQPIDTLIVAGGSGIHQALGDRTFVRFITARAQRSRRICSVCTGAFALAEAGCLTVGALRLIGQSARSSGPDTRGCMSSRIRSLFATGTSGPRLESPRASILRWHLLNRITGAPSRLQWPASWWSFSSDRADSHNLAHCSPLKRRTASLATCRRGSLRTLSAICQSSG
jgi:hypothetical protein